MTRDDNTDSEQSGSERIRVRVWRGWYDEVPDEPDEVVELTPDEPHVWQDDPWFHEKVELDIHPEDAPATLYVRTNDSVREPHPSDTSEWTRPIERGLPFDPERYDDYPPFGCEIWGRVLFTVEKGLTR